MTPLIYFLCAVGALTCAGAVIVALNYLAVWIQRRQARETVPKAWTHAIGVTGKARDRMGLGERSKSWRQP